jgi:hypothetical protein
MTLNLFAKYSAALLALLSMGCSEAERPTIRVGIGMPVGELMKGSTFPFTENLAEPERTGDCASYHWTITEPYDLIYIHGKNVLERKDLGGRAFLLAITAFDRSNGECAVDSIGITYQNRQLSIDEALEEAQNAQTWLLKAGFRKPTDSERRNGYFSDPYSAEQVLTASPMKQPLANIADVRAAFIDPHAGVKKVVISQLIDQKAGAAIWIENARRASEEIGGQYVENNLESEKRYYLYIDFTIPNLRIK